ncbi:hypothetical protein MMC12_005193 [Toensbergia leucococca]|nr:hypothetical protein [Toensbergia leucococca]
MSEAGQSARASVPSGDDGWQVVTGRRRRSRRVQESQAPQAPQAPQAVQRGLSNPSQLREDPSGPGTSAASTLPGTSQTSSRSSQTDDADFCSAPQTPQRVSRSDRPSSSDSGTFFSATDADEIASDTEDITEQAVVRNVVTSEEASSLSEVTLSALQLIGLTTDEGKQSEDNNEAQVIEETQSLKRDEEVHGEPGQITEPATHLETLLPVVPGLTQQSIEASEGADDALLGRGALRSSEEESSVREIAPPLTIADEVITPTTSLGDQSIISTPTPQAQVSEAHAIESTSQHQPEQSTPRASSITRATPITHRQQRLPAFTTLPQIPRRARVPGMTDAPASSPPSQSSTVDEAGDNMDRPSFAIPSSSIPSSLIPSSSTPSALAMAEAGDNMDRPSSSIPSTLIPSTSIPSSSTPPPSTPPRFLPTSPATATLSASAKPPLVRSKQARRQVSTESSGSLGSPQAAGSSRITAQSKPTVSPAAKAAPMKSAPGTLARFREIAARQAKGEAIVFDESPEKADPPHVAQRSLITAHSRSLVSPAPANSAARGLALIPPRSPRGSTPVQSTASPSDRPLAGDPDETFVWPVRQPPVESTNHPSRSVPLQGRLLGMRVDPFKGRLTGTEPYPGAIAGGEMYETPNFNEVTAGLFDQHQPVARRQYAPENRDPHMRHFCNGQWVELCECQEGHYTPPTAPSAPPAPPT